MTEITITTDTIGQLAPEIILVAAATWIYLGGAFRSGRMMWNLGATVALAAAAYALYLQSSGDAFQQKLTGPLVVDYFGYALRWMVLVVGFLFVLLLSKSAEDDLASDYLGSLLLILAGLLLTCQAGELVLLFVALELISIPTYILLFLGRADTASHEATTKYFFLSILSSALLLYGFSFLYGVTGSTRLDEIRRVLTALEPDGIAALLPLALILILAGLGFKLAAVPFHFYAPDVYQGTTSGNAGMLAVVPKIAGVVVLGRLIVVAMPGLEPLAWKIVLSLSLVTMTLGNVLALWQRNIRRLLAYSSIAHAGYLLIGLAVALAVAAGAGFSGRFDGLAAMLFYLLVYALATTGAFAALAYLSQQQREIDTVDELAGLGKTHPLIAVTIALFMFSLAGVPPLAGFLGKLTLFFSALDVDAATGGKFRPWFVTLAIGAAINAAIALAYYLRVVAVMYFREPINVPRARGGPGAWLAAVASALLILGATVFGGRLIDRANTASQAVRAISQPPVELQTADLE